MKTTDLSAFADAELVEQFAAEPDLLAIADAISATQPAPRGRRRLLLPRLLLTGAAAAAGAATLLLLAPWQQNGHPFVDRALAAVGNAPVLHTVVRVQSGLSLIDVETGREVPQLITIETWYDGERELEHTVFRTDGRLTGEDLLTPEGGVTSDGPVYDCAWIAAHPVEATKAPVSCNAAGRNGTTPRTIPRPPPPINPALAGFIDGYRKALASGTARRVGEGTVGGRLVVWLELDVEGGQTERVALDKESLRPLLIRPESGGDIEVLSIETVARAAADFSRPRPLPKDERESSGFKVDISSTQLKATEVASTLPGALWLGSAFRGLELVRIERQTLATTYAANAGLERTSGTGVTFFYGETKPNGDPDFSGEYVRLMESSDPQPAYWARVPAALVPPAGRVLTLGDSSGFLLRHGVYVAFQSAGNSSVLEIARALASVPGGS